MLIRGTDYTTSHLPGHPIMASPEQVMEKIKEYEATGKYDEIFLAEHGMEIMRDKSDDYVKVMGVVFKQIYRKYR